MSHYTSNLKSSYYLMLVFMASYSLLMDAKSLKMLAGFVCLFFFFFGSFLLRLALFLFPNSFILGSVFYVRRFPQKTSDLWLTVNKRSKKLISISNLDFLIVSSKFILTILWCLLFYKFWKIKWLIYSHKKCLEYSQSLQNILILYTFNIDSVFIQPEMEKLYKTQHKDWFMKTSKNLSATILPSLNFLKSAHITINSGLPRI